MSEENNPFAVASTQRETTTEMQMTRSQSEVQGRMVIAKKFPRDQLQCMSKILEACKRKSLAESAIYSYPRGGTSISGPSIRLAEAVAQIWGNLSFGVIELSQKEGESEVLSYAWDLESNTYQDKVFTVKHQRKARGEIKQLEDPRDIYEMTANQGSRRLRACILGVVPGDVIEKAVEACTATLSGGSSVPLADRALKMVSAFSDFGVNKEMIEGRLGHRLDVVTESELVNLRNIYTSLKDNFGKVTDYFEYTDVEVEVTQVSEKKKTRKPRSDIGKKRNVEPVKDELVLVAEPKGPETEAAEKSWGDILQDKINESRVTEMSLLEWLQSSGMVSGDIMNLSELEEKKSKQLCTIFESVAKNALEQSEA